MPRPSALSSLTQFCRNSIKIKKPGDFFTCNTYMFFRRILYKRDKKAGRMSKFLRYLVCLLMLVMVGNAMAVTYYNCPAYKKYTSCAAGKYISDCGDRTSVSISSNMLTVGNSCLDCPTNYACNGGTSCPTRKIVTITYNLNGGTGTTPASQKCSAGASCTLNSGNTTSFKRNGYALVGWSIFSDDNSGVFSITAPQQNATYYAVWRACAKGYYKPTTATARASCSVCPQGTYRGSTGATSCLNIASGYYGTGCTSFPQQGIVMGCTGSTACTNFTYCSNGIQHTVDSGYYATGCSTSVRGRACTGQAQCGTAYYCTGGERYACDTGLVTAGHGLGADEADDCGRVLHIGDQEVILRSGIATTPSLRVLIDGTTFYGKLDSTGTYGTIHIGNYTLYDDRARD